MAGVRQEHVVACGGDVRFLRAFRVASQLNILHHLVLRSTHGGLLGLAG